jgi:hypothetical protein
MKTEEEDDRGQDQYLGRWDRGHETKGMRDEHDDDILVYNPTSETLMQQF